MPVRIQYVRLDYNLTLNTRSRNTVFIEVFDDKPLTQANFMEYVNGDRYDGIDHAPAGEELRDSGRRILSEFVEEPPPVNVFARSNGHRGPGWESGHSESDGNE